ncbi:MAG: hypothetical protein RLZZ436_698 [Planctomycetota bacterium]|jgi:hypothetical protein
MLAWTRSFLRPRRRQSARSRSVTAAIQVLEPRQVLNAVTVQLSAVRDTTIYDTSAQALSNGTGQYLVSGGASGSIAARRGLLAFDLQSAGIPEGATIIDAVLTLNVAESFGNTLSVGLHPVSRSWGESASDAAGNELDGAAALAGDATWLFSRFDSAAWALPGGDIGGASATSQVDGPGAWQWAGGGVVADVQQWLDQPQLNHGWMLRSSESVGDIKTFHSRNSSNPALQPQLEITYEEPFIPSIVEGRKWHDRNADGIRQSPVLAQLRLFHPNGNAFFNSLGGQEYWYRSQVNSSWYFLTPAGELKQWSGQSGKLTGTTVEMLGTRAWHNRAPITNAAAITEEPWLNGFVFELLDQDGKVVAVTSSRDLDRNGDSLIDAEQERGWYRFENVAPGKYTVREVLPEGWVQSAGRTSPGAATARSLDQSLNLSFSGNLFENFGGLGERWLKGGSNSWFYITPAGQLFRWNNRTVTATAPLTGTPIAAPGNAYYQDVSLLHSAENPVLDVTSGSVTTRFDFGNYQPSVIEGRTWIDTDPNGNRNPSRLPTAVGIPRPVDATVTSSAIAWYEVYAPVTDPLLATESDPPVRRIFYLTSTGQVFEWSSSAPPRLFTQISTVSGSAAAAISRAAFAAEPWQNGITVQLLNASGYVVAEAVTTDLDRNADGRISSETEQGWYRFTGLPPGQYSLRQLLPTGSVALTEAPATLLQTARSLADTWRFEAAPSDHFNFGGRNERWFRSRSQEWFYILPSGAVHQWDRNSGGRLGLVRGKLIAQLSGAFFVNLGLIFQPPTAAFSLQPGQTLQRSLAQVRLLDTVFSSIAGQIQ